jgi:hypothetical protein
MAGRTLYEIATGRVPVPGRPLDPADLKDCGVSAVVADAIDGLGSGSFSSVVPTLRYITRHRTVHAVRAVRANVHADVPRPEPALQLAESSDASRPAMGSAVAPGAARPGIPVAVPAVAAPAPAVSSSSTAPVPRRAVSAPTISASTPAPLATAPASAANRPAPASRGLWRRLVERATSWRVRRTHAPTARPSATPN